MQLDLLDQLADFIDTLPPQRFDYGQWVGDDWDGKPDLACGTTACAAGWATVLWPERLRMLPGGELIRCVPQFAVRTPDGWKQSPDNFRDIMAVAYAFELPEDVAAAMFIPGMRGETLLTDCYAPAKEAPPAVVAKHLRRCVAQLREFRELTSPEQRPAAPNVTKLLRQGFLSLSSSDSEKLDQQASAALEAYRRGDSIDTAEFRRELSSRIQQGRV